MIVRVCHDPATVNLLKDAGGRARDLRSTFAADGVGDHWPVADWGGRWEMMWRWLLYENCPVYAFSRRLSSVFQLVSSARLLTLILPALLATSSRTEVDWMAQEFPRKMMEGKTGSRTLSGLVQMSRRVRRNFAKRERPPSDSENVTKLPVRRTDRTAFLFLLELNWLGSFGY